MQVLILAGGKGTRLWPLSIGDHPKQFLKLPQLLGKSMFQLTILRACKIVNLEDILVVVTSLSQKKVALEQVSELDLSIPMQNILVGPKKDTFGAIVFGLSFCEDYTLILPTDHLIENENEFYRAIEEAKKMAKCSLVLFGIKPDSPHTGYGYIKPCAKEPSVVERFVEKPNLPLARRYVRAGYLWNSGMFLFRKEIFFEELNKVNRSLYELYFKFSVKKFFSFVPSTSVDYALLEKSKNIRVVNLGIKWRDVGNFDSLSESKIYCEDLNQGTENTFFYNAKNNMVQDVEGKKIVISDVSDLIVVNTNEGLLITKKGKSENVKKVVEEFETENINLDVVNVRKKKK